MQNTTQKEDHNLNTICLYDKCLTRERHAQEKNRLEIRTTLYQTRRNKTPPRINTERRLIDISQTSHSDVATLQCFFFGTKISEKKLVLKKCNVTA
jgi:hypothetical protein